MIKKIIACSALTLSLNANADVFTGDCLTYYSLIHHATMYNGERPVTDPEVLNNALRRMGVSKRAPIYKSYSQALNANDKYVYPECNRRVEFYNKLKNAWVSSVL